MARLRDADLLTIKNLLDTVQAEHQANADTFGEYIDDERIEELQKAYDAFDDDKTSPRTQQTSGQSARLSLRGEFKNLSQLTQGRLKPLMRKYKRRNRPFWDRVEAARKVVDRSATRPAAPAGVAGQ